MKSTCVLGDRKVDRTSNKLANLIEELANLLANIDPRNNGSIFTGKGAALALSLFPQLVYRLLSEAQSLQSPLDSQT